MVRSNSVLGLGPARRPSSVVVVPTRASATPALITSARNEIAMVDNRMSPEFPSDFNLTQIEATVDWLESRNTGSHGRRPAGVAVRNECTLCLRVRFFCKLSLQLRDARAAPSSSSGPGLTIQPGSRALSFSYAPARAMKLA